MKTAPETIPPDPDDEVHFIAFLKESARTTSETPCSLITEWKAEILTTALMATSVPREKKSEGRAPLNLVPFPLRIAWAALWITAAGFHFVTPESPLSTPPVRRPTAAALQQLTKNGQSLRTITPMVRFHTLKRELPLR
jgi:hypothetical protein